MEPLKPEANDVFLLFVAEVQVVDTVSSVSNIAFTDKDDVNTRKKMGVAKMDMLGVFQVVGRCDYRVNIVFFLSVCVALCNVNMFYDAFDYTFGQLKKITCCLFLLRL